LLPRFDAEYEVCNWFTGTHPQSPYLNNLIAPRPGPDRTRLTLFNARFNVRHASGLVAVTAIIGLIAFPLLQPAWVMVR
jgi:N-hydroxyarylamine O-acetyltransferase